MDSEKALRAHDELMAQVRAKMAKLVASPRFTFATKPKSSELGAGVYLFTDQDGRPFYVGRTRDAHKRFGQHCRDGSPPNQSSTAFKLACDALGIERSRYRKGDGWKSVVARRPEVMVEFKRQKALMREMHIQFVAEPDPVRQALLEIVCAECLGTPHNDFDTH